MRDGASVRYNLNVTGEEAYNENGIRFTAFIPTATYNGLETLEQTDGVKVSYGMLIAPYSYYGTYGEFTEATVFGVNGTKKYTWTGDTAQVENATQIVNITRPYYVRVRAQDRNGEWFEAEDEGLTARCFCHEIEHLDGHLFVERTDRLMEGEELQQWLRDHAEDYEFDEEMEDEE